jgi:hypothetical protein
MSLLSFGTIDPLDVYFNAGNIIITSNNPSFSTPFNYYDGKWHQFIFYLPSLNTHPITFFLDNQFYSYISLAFTSPNLSTILIGYSPTAASLAVGNSYPSAYFPGSVDDFLIFSYSPFPALILNFIPFIGSCLMLSISKDLYTFAIQPIKDITFTKLPLIT